MSKCVVISWPDMRLGLPWSYKVKPPCFVSSTSNSCSSRNYVFCSASLQVDLVLLFSAWFSLFKYEIYFNRGCLTLLCGWSVTRAGWFHLWCGHSQWSNGIQRNEYTEKCIWRKYADWNCSRGKVDFQKCTATPYLVKPECWMAVGDLS